ncbi:hypothetical protein OIU85_017526 [Salix viminalis]|uniref:Uncharacterized protein n=1 Tax=Salix viminalis TaxID=40686 RepID=A0A9Q0V847_SALVM|nr:hypothetical protein OIU85_017526 [Salix viminalis]
MALVLRRVPSLAKRGSKIPQIFQLSFPVPCQTQHSFSTSSSSSDPLLTKLLQNTNLQNHKSSSTEKAHLVLEWRLRENA